MSYAHSLAKFRNELGHGCARRAYYSKKYNKVFKVCKYNDDIEQSQIEARLFEKYGAEELRHICPITEVIYDKKTPIIVMEKVDIVYDYINERFSGRDALRMQNMDFFPLVHSLETLDIIKTDNLSQLFTFLKNERIGDIHSRNLGIFEGRLVLTDLGWRES